MDYEGRHGSGRPGRSAEAGEHGEAQAAPDDLLRAAREWAADDPDARASAELLRLVQQVEDGGADAADARADLADRFAGMLEFGTAGLRGAIGAGPNRMNRSVVIRTAAALTATIAARQESVRTTPDAAGPPFAPHDVPVVVIGYDGRHLSDVFARDTAAVVTAAGGRAMVLPRLLPTPVLAFATPHTGSDAGVMVTASHNPPQDNGYKVYLDDGSQIVPPIDAEIAGRIAAIRATSEIPLARDGWVTLGEDVVDAYLDAITGLVDPGSPRDVRIVHTALHGVGTDVVVEALRRCGFPTPTLVERQARPDADFPTVAFPNPEEDGALDLALAAAREAGADVLIANDPDADRCAVAVPDPAVEGGWRLLRGDELGALLGSHLIMRGVPEGGSFACSIVSSRLLARMCEAVGIRHEETLTGFKWISKVPGLAYGYEEALGYCVAPQWVKDKDGVSAALLVAELVAILKAEGRSLLDVLDDLHRQYGVHATDAFSVRVERVEQVAPIMARLRAEPPAQIAGTAVVTFDDLAKGDGGLPPTDGLRWVLEDGARVIVRPSGTEPKLKVYLEAVTYAEPGDDDGLAQARRLADERLTSLREHLTALTAL
ncbi:phospho-sugar mutase [Marihabitans asiaticum]|uniref:Phosphomannomutase n=1 Tax=Marihabitans asiaticum TaxID=415218 RepID=A0A560WD22_9MICO|nr:phospho-sugar mutase [Marihabitans asiaticum]TWD15476.1 phosphomannomutase [Marihabitans asiaticum]